MKSLTQHWRIILSLVAFAGFGVLASFAVAEVKKEPLWLVLPSEVSAWLGLFSGVYLVWEVSQLSNNAAAKKSGEFEGRRLVASLVVKNALTILKESHIELVAIQNNPASLITQMKALSLLETTTQCLAILLRSGRVLKGEGSDWVQEVATNLTLVEEVRAKIKSEPATYIVLNSDTQELLSQLSRGLEAAINQTINNTDHERVH